MGRGGGLLIVEFILCKMKRTLSNRFTVQPPEALRASRVMHFMLFLWFCIKENHLWWQHFLQKLFARLLLTHKFVCASVVITITIFNTLIPLSKRKNDAFFIRGNNQVHGFFLRFSAGESMVKWKFTTVNAISGVTKIMCNVPHWRISWCLCFVGFLSGDLYLVSW